jgi:hypothetical protein
MLRYVIVCCVVLCCVTLLYVMFMLCCVMLRYEFSFHTVLLHRECFEKSAVWNLK